MKIKHVFPAALGLLSLLGVTATTVAAEKTAPATGVGETITTTVRVQAVNLGKRQLTVRNQEGETFTIDVPPEVRRLAEIRPGDLIVAEHREALAVGLHRTDTSTGIRERRESVSVERAGMDQPPGLVARETIQVLANVVAIDQAQRKVTIRGAEHTVILKVSEGINLDEIAVGDEVLAVYIQEVAINLEPAPAAAIQGWKSR
jgi:Cu/Ag efflux protein CusF